ncbi:hypothetical protein HDU76_007902 [Blyttiomyces sp. JEL0837]|nr:hypothetical protein HDU76_007902 [Blyttiomyces sp. JEL0837]
MMGVRNGGGSSGRGRSVESGGSMSEDGQESHHRYKKSFETCRASAESAGFILSNILRYHPSPSTHHLYFPVSVSAFCYQASLILALLRGNVDLLNDDEGYSERLMGYLKAFLTYFERYGRFWPLGKVLAATLRRVLDKFGVVVEEDLVGEKEGTMNKKDDGSGDVDKKGRSVSESMESDGGSSRNNNNSNRSVSMSVGANAGGGGNIGPVTGEEVLKEVLDVHAPQHPTETGLDIKRFQFLSRNISEVISAVSSRSVSEVGSKSGGSGSAREDGSDASEYGLEYPGLNMFRSPPPMGAIGGDVGGIERGHGQGVGGTSFARTVVFDGHGQGDVVNGGSQMNNGFTGVRAPLFPVAGLGHLGQPVNGILLVAPSIVANQGGPIGMTGIGMNGFPMQQPVRLSHFPADGFGVGVNGGMLGDVTMNNFRPVPAAPVSNVDVNSLTFAMSSDMDISNGGGLGGGAGGQRLPFSFDPSWLLNFDTGMYGGNNGGGF